MNDLLGRLLSLLPAGTTELQEDFKKNVKTVVAAALTRMDLVTREEFDVQAALLTRTRAKLEAMERQMTVLEAQLGQRSPAPPDRD